MNKVQFIRAPSGDELAVLPRAEYERLLEEAEMQEDIRLYDEAARALAAGEDEMIPSEFVHRLLEGESPIRVWREFRGISLEELARQAGIGVDRLSEIEGDDRFTDPEALG